MGVALGGMGVQADDLGKHLRLRCNWKPPVWWWTMVSLRMVSRPSDPKLRGEYRAVLPFTSGSWGLKACCGCLGMTRMR